MDTRHMRSAKNVLREIECKASDDGGAAGTNNYSVLRELESKSRAFRVGQLVTNIYRILETGRASARIFNFIIVLATVDAP